MAAGAIDAGEEPWMGETTWLMLLERGMIPVTPERAEC